MNPALNAQKPGRQAEGKTSSLTRRDFQAGIGMSSLTYQA